MFKAFANIARIPDLRRKFLFTLGLLAVCRIGTWIPLPGVDTQKIAEIIKQCEQKRTSGGNDSGAGRNRDWNANPCHTPQ